MSLRFHEIAEGDHRILNPLTEDKLMLIGEICRLQPDMRQLDLACGKGEMLAQWAKRWRIQGVGVDISKVFLAAARERAAELNVADRLEFVEADAGQYVTEAGQFDIVSCIGATWIGGGLVGTLRLMLSALKPGGLLLVGEPYWIDSPPDEAYEASGLDADEYTTLIGTLERFESFDLDLVEMVLSSHDSWDRYAAAQWWTINAWIAQHPDDPDVDALREWNAKNRWNYLNHERRYFGWGVFILKVK